MQVQWPHWTDPHGLTETQVLYITPLRCDGLTSHLISMVIFSEVTDIRILNRRYSS